MLRERGDLSSVLPEVTNRPDLLELPHGALLDKILGDLQDQAKKRNFPAFSELLRNYGKILLSWWRQRIINRTAEVTFIDDSDGGWYISFFEGEKRAELSIRFYNGVMDSPRIKSSTTLKDETEQEWEVIFNKNQIESIEKTIVHVDPEYKLSVIKEVQRISQSVPSFLAE